MVYTPKVKLASNPGALSSLIPHRTYSESESTEIYRFAGSGLSTEEPSRVAVYNQKVSVQSDGLVIWLGLNDK